MKMYLAGRRVVIIIFALSSALSSPLTSLCPAQVAIQALKVESLINPTLDILEPRLSWQHQSNQRGMMQSAYEVLVASSPDQLKQGQPDLWDSGKVASDQSINVVYAGKPLQSDQVCSWKVRAWDQDGHPTDDSPAAQWSMGLLKPADWQGKWIGFDGGGVSPTTAGKTSNDHHPLPARYLRRQFNIGKQIASAQIHLAGLGLSELYINGSKVSDDLLSPALAQYDKRIFYVSYDVTQQIRQGGNALGVILGNGRFYAPRLNIPTKTTSFGYPKLLLQLNIRFTDGSYEAIVSDQDWKLSTDGPITANNEYDGEDYDARKEMPGWDSPAFDDSKWQAVQAVEPPGGTLSEQPIEPIRATQTIAPVEITNPRPGVFIYDMGQNIVGFCRLTVSGPAGTIVTLRHAETLQDGELYTANLRSARATDHYILKGGGEEVYQPRFTYHGFRYVEVTGFPGTPSKSNLLGLVVNTDVAPAGAFACSNDLLNQIYRDIDWGVRGNYRSLPTDCPQRDERQGWTGDRAAESLGETFLFGVDSLYATWMNDLQDSQRTTGSLPDVAPTYWPLYHDSVTWPGAFVIIPGTLYQQYGDARVIAGHYPAMRRWMSYMATFIKNGLISKDSYGDWCVPPESMQIIHSKDRSRMTSKTVLATTYYYHLLDLMAAYAPIAGHPEDAAEYKARAAAMRNAFNASQFKPDQAIYDNGSQTSSILPLSFGMVPEQKKDAVFQALVHNITEKTNSHIGTGLIGGQWLMRVLCDNGRPDLAFTLATQTTYPSWGYMVKSGATTIWELWNGNTAEPSMNSGNHVMLVGDLAIWMFEYLAGIRSDFDQPGFKHIILKPVFAGDLTAVTATHQSPYGLIQSAWKLTGNIATWDFTIPANTHATVYVPTEHGDSISENGKNKIDGMKFEKVEGSAQVFEAVPGTYHIIFAR